MAPSRRTHIVRIPADKNAPDDNYVDVEVLDAIAFKGPKGEDMVLNFKKENIVPYIVDNTGGGNGKENSKATRRSHMERIKGDGGATLDVEVLDIVSFRTTNGDEYIMNLPSAKASAFSTNGTSDGGNNTRRTHNEKIYKDGKKDPVNFMTVTRTDAVAFRTIMGKELIIKMPSSDDGGTRADTYTTPQGYDPTKDEPKPPINKDPNVYVSFPKKDSNPFTGDAKISQGPFWWIRKVKGGTPILVIQIRIRRTNSAGAIGIKSDFGIKADSYDTNGGDLDLMPFKQPPATVTADELKLKDTKAWRGNNSNAAPPPIDGGSGSGSGSSSAQTDFTALLFVNVPVAKANSTDKTAKGDAAQKITIDVTMPKMPPPDTQNGTTGYYWWLVSGGDQFTFVPIHPPPDANNAFDVYPFTDQGNPPGITYIGLWNQQFFFNAAGFIHYGIPVPPSPDNGAYGWKTAAEAAQAVSSQNAFNVADYNNAIANMDPEHPFQLPPPSVYETLTLDFAGGTPKKSTIAVDVTATLYSGILNFPFDANNNLIGLPAIDPNDPNQKKASAQSTNGDPARTIRVTLDKDEGLSVVVSNTAP